MTQSTIKTPCIGVCSTGIGDSVCRGCKRFAHEVIHWNGYSEDERAHILRRIEALLSQVVQARVEVFNSQRLERELTRHGVRYNSGLNDACLAYEAIRAFGGQLDDLTLIGCRAQAQWRHLSTSGLKQSIDEAFYQLSCAHYERYFPHCL